MISQAPLLTVILPTLNEAGNVGPLTAEIWKTIPGCPVLVVDDGSTDGTRDAVRGLEAEGHPIRLIARDGKPCLTDSIAEGVRLARTPYVAWMDADLSHPPSVLPALLAAAQEHRCAIATRYAPGGSQHKATRDTPDSLAANILSGVMNVIVRHWLGMSLTDYTSGFIVCDRSLIQDHEFVGDYGEYFIELTYSLTRRGVQIQEIPYHSPPRQWGASKTGASLGLLARRGTKYAWLALRIRLPKRAFGRLSLAVQRKPTA